VVVQYQNNLDDYREMTDCIAALRRPVNSPLQIVFIAIVFGAYYVITRFLWQKAGDADGHLAWVNMWIAIVAFGVTWLGMSIPASLRSRQFPWLTRRQWISLGTFIALIGALIFQHWMNQKFNPNARKDAMTLQIILPHSIWLTILVYVSVIAAHNRSTSIPRHWQNRPDLHRHQTLDISAPGVVFSDTDSRREYQWTAFLKGEETRYLFLLFSWEYGATMIPKRAFASSEELEAMRNLMKLIPRDSSRGFPIAPLAAQQVSLPAADAA
jgi:hypothetical protein